MARVRTPLPARASRGANLKLMLGGTGFDAMQSGRIGSSSAVPACLVMLLVLLLVMLLLVMVLVMLLLVMLLVMLLGVGAPGAARRDRILRGHGD